MRPTLATSIFIEAALRSEPITIHGSGTQTRCFTHVSDIAEGIRVVMQRAEFCGVINIADDREYSVLDLARIAMKVTGATVELRHTHDRAGQIFRSKIDNTRLRGLGWEPIMCLESGLRGVVTERAEPVPRSMHPEKGKFTSQDTLIVACTCPIIQTQLPSGAVGEQELGSTVWMANEVFPDGTQIVMQTAGDLRSREVAVRIHSECLFGDVLGSRKCDCGAQRDRFRKEMLRNAGVFAYVKGHEGRGAGLEAKLAAYAAVEAEPALHHNDALLLAGATSIDDRTYDAAAELILRVVLGEIQSCAPIDAQSPPSETTLVVHSNNADKVAAVRRALARRARCSHVSVRQQELPAGLHQNRHNEKYLLEKARDNGQHGLLVEPSSYEVCHPAVDDLPGVRTSINCVSFEPSDPCRLTFFQKHGWVVLRNVIPPETVSAVVVQYETMIHTQYAELEHAFGVGQSYEEYRNEISQHRDVFLQGGPFHDLIFSEEESGLHSLAQSAMAEAELACQMGGTSWSIAKGGPATEASGLEWNGIKLLHDHIIAKPAGANVSKKIPLHQDTMFWPVDTVGCSSWTALEAVEVGGGCLEVVELPHAPHLTGHCSPPVDFMADETETLSHLLAQCGDEKPTRWLLPVQPGSTILLHSLTWHRSSPNLKEASNRPAHIALWVHPSARWRPDLVPWHPVNEHIPKSCEGQVLAGQRHPTFGEHCDIAGVDQTWRGMEKDLHQSAIKDSGSDISMFDASEVVATQMRNIVMLGGEFEWKGVPLVELLQSTSCREHIAMLSCEKLSHWLNDSNEELKPLLAQSGCKTLADVVLKTLRRLQMSAAAYSQNRSRNVFNDAYMAWWKLAGRQWKALFHEGPFLPDYELDKSHVSTFLSRIDVDPSLYKFSELELLQAVVSRCMSVLPFQNFTMLSQRLNCPKWCLPTLGQIVNDMVNGLGGLCTVRNPFMFLLLKALGFQHVQFISGTMYRWHGTEPRKELPNAHVALLVQLGGEPRAAHVAGSPPPTAVEKELYWLDVGNGHP